MAQIGNGVTLRGLEVSSDYVTVNLDPAITEADEGKALAVSASGANLFKLAGDGDIIRGFLDKVENREIEGVVVGSMCTRGWFKLPLAEDDAATYGDSIVGAGDGLVKKADAANSSYVADIEDGYVVARIIG